MKGILKKKGLLAILAVLLVTGLLIPTLSFLAALALVIFCIAVVASALNSRGSVAPKGVDTKTYGVASAGTQGRALTPDERQTIANANAGLVQIRTASSRVRDAQIREKFAQTADVLSDILKALKADPDQIQPAHRVLSYYIPSLQEILKKYVRLETGGVELGDTPDKLKEHLDEIVGALQKQYQNIYGDNKLDLTVEMKAMSIALKRDGLVEDNMASLSFEETLAQTARDFEQQAAAVEG